MAAKNTKLTWMRPTFESALAEWQYHWNSAVDEVYIDPEVTYIDIGRQMTLADTGPHGRVLIWRRCCMDRLWRRRLQWSRIQNRLYYREEDACKDESGKRQAPPIRRTTYPFVTLRDARDMTITPSSSSWELRNGLVYSQFYNLIKVPFDAAKQYPFQNRHTESMALDLSLKYSLPETVIMAAVLRGLRFSYDCSLIAKESVLWGDKWTSTQRVRVEGGEARITKVEREGLGLNKTSISHGFGWWLPGKFDWSNDLLRQDYKRQWRVLKDIRDVHVLIELFQRDVWRVALKSVSWKTGSDVTDEASMKYPESSPLSFCYDGLSNLFHDRQRDVSYMRPHLVAGNKIRSISMKDLFDDLFSPSSTGMAMKRRRGWALLPYCIATR
ncbi:hypothetical protein FOXYSP1_13066 [Fusarium oxysporum f. sp. phaseoli]